VEEVCALRELRARENNIEIERDLDSSGGEVYRFEGYT